MLPKAMSKSGQWAELKKYAKQKRMPLSVANVIRIVKQHAGEAEAARDGFITHVIFPPDFGLTEQKLAHKIITQNEARQA